MSTEERTPLASLRGGKCPMIVLTRHLGVLPLLRANGSNSFYNKSSSSRRWAMLRPNNNRNIIHCGQDRKKLWTLIFRGLNSKCMWISRENSKVRRGRILRVWFIGHSTNPKSKTAPNRPRWTPSPPSTNKPQSTTGPKSRSPHLS